MGTKINICAKIYIVKRDLRLIKIPNNMVLQDAIPSDYNHYF